MPEKNHGNAIDRKYMIVGKIVMELFSLYIKN